MTFKDMNTPKTMDDRWVLIRLLTDMVTTDFGTQDGLPYDPRNAGDRARVAVVELAAAYERFSEVETIADDILLGMQLGKIDSDNIEPVGL